MRVGTLRIRRVLRAWGNGFANALLIYTPAVTWTLIIADAVLGLGMVFQPLRFSRTPSYGNLIAIAPIQLWGVVHVVVAAALAAWRAGRSPVVGVVAHLAVTGLTFSWWLAFIVRYFTDDATTIVNVVSWGVLLSLVARSVVGLDEDDR